MAEYRVLNLLKHMGSAESGISDYYPYEPDITAIFQLVDAICKTRYLVSVKNWVRRIGASEVANVYGILKQFPDMEKAIIISCGSEFTEEAYETPAVEKGEVILFCESELEEIVRTNKNINQDEVRSPNDPIRRRKMIKEFLSPECYIKFITECFNRKGTSATKHIKVGNVVRHLYKKGVTVSEDVIVNDLKHLARAGEITREKEENFGYFYYCYYPVFTRENAETAWGFLKEHLGEFDTNDFWRCCSKQMKTVWQSADLYQGREDF